MSHPGSAWTPPDPQVPPVHAAAPGPTSRPPTPASAGGSYVGGVPLGGVLPAHEESVAPSHRRELLLAGILLVGAVLAGAASLMSWRDDGILVGPVGSGTGGGLPDGSMGRGWGAVLLGVVLAVGGVLIASGRLRAGRAVATVGGVALVLFSVLEWGLGAGRARTGPGVGIWVLFLVGVVVVIAVGILGTAPTEHATA